MFTILREGANYSVSHDGEIAVVKVWKRPDLSFEDGARLAEEIAGHLLAIVAGTLVDATGIVLDLREAPDLIGKRTREAMGDVLLRCEAAGFRFAIVIRSATQAVIVERVTQDPNEGRARYVHLTRSYDEALGWVAESTGQYHV